MEHSALPLLDDATAATVSTLRNGDGVLTVPGLYAMPVVYITPSWSVNAS